MSDDDQVAGAEDIVDSGSDDDTGSDADDGDEQVGGDFEDTDNVIARGGDVVGEVKLRGRDRSISDSVREAFKKAAGVVKTQIEADDEEFGDPDEIEPAEAAPAVVEAPAEKPVVPVPAPVVPDTALVEQKAKLAADREALELERAQYAEERKAGDFAKFRDLYHEDPAGAVVAFIKQFGGIDDAGVNDEVSDLIAELASTTLKVAMDPAERSRLDAKRALRTARAAKAEAAAERAELERKQSQFREHDEVARIQTSLHKEITKPEVATSMPFLAALDNAGQVVWNVIADYHKRGEELKWQDAAKLANDYLEKEGRAWFVKHSHLLSASPASAGGDSSKAKTAPGAPSGHRGARTITNATASAAAPPRKAPTPDPNRKWTAEDHRAETKRRFRAAFRPATDD